MLFIVNSIVLLMVTKRLQRLVRRCLTSAGVGYLVALSLHGARNVPDGFSRANACAW